MRTKCVQSCGESLAGVATRVVASVRSAANIRRVLRIRFSKLAFDSAGLVPFSETNHRPKRERSVGIQSLLAGPTNRVTLPLYLDLSLEPQPFPRGPFRQRELGLADLARQWITGIQASACEHAPIRIRHGNAQHAWHRRNAVVHHSKN